MSGWYGYVNRIYSTIHVQMNDIQIVFFPQQDQDMFITTANLSGCHCVAIVSRSAAILAHFAPSAGIPGSEMPHLHAYMAAIYALYNQYSNYFVDQKVYAVLGMFQGEVWSREAYEYIIGQLRTIHPQPEERFYTTQPSSEPAHPEKGTVVIGRPAGGQLIISIEGRAETI